MSSIIFTHFIKVTVEVCGGSPYACSKGMYMCVSLMGQSKQTEAQGKHLHPERLCWAHLSSFSMQIKTSVFKMCTYFPETSIWAIFLLLGDSWEKQIVIFKCILWMVLEYLKTIYALCMLEGNLWSATRASSRSVVARWSAERQRTQWWW